MSSSRMPPSDEITRALLANKTNWDLLTPIHADSSFYDVEGFIDGNSTLKKPELQLIKSVKGKKLLHLQCHFGLDTLSWARLGADVTGVDFSPVAVETAQRLARESNIPANFVCSDVMNLPDDLGTFDILVTTYGVLCWLNNLESWSRGISRHLNRGGTFLLVDFHPILESLNPGKMTGSKGYFYEARPAEVLTSGTYAAPQADIAYREYRWQHSMGAVITSLINSGLCLKKVEEYPYSSFGIFDELTLKPDGLWWNETSPNRIPYMFSVLAEKPQATSSIQI